MKDLKTEGDVMEEETMKEKKKEVEHNGRGKYKERINGKWKIKREIKKEEDMKVGTKKSAYKLEE